MNAWPSIQLGEICSPKQHRTISGSDLTDAGYPAFGANGQIGFYKTYTHDQETVAITCRGATCGTVNIVPAYSYISGNAMALDNLDHTRADINFLAYSLRFRGLNDVISGSAQPQITRAPLLGVRILLPPLPEQRRIAAILDQADALRAKRREALAKLDEMAQAIFVEMFGALPAEDRLSFADGVEEFRYGTSNKSGDGGLPTLRIPNVVGGAIDLNDMKRVSVTQAELNRLRLKTGDVLFVRTNGNPNYVGRCAVFTDDIANSTEYSEEPFIFASYLIRARLKTKVFDPVFVQSYLSSPDGRRQLRDVAKTSAGQFNVNTDGLASLRLPNAPLGQQKLFADQIKKIKSSKVKHFSQLSTLDALFTSLQHRAFSGTL
ncbi:restriction endonuclease subunit S [Acidocella sp.]|uniref:restriction endonuclease subunit S n=1 Tax=Acidocella sp. TaxID=50710 RepID=UPI003D047EEA